MGNSATNSGDIIRTPDQRLRVFVSSTLQEVAAERTAVQQAIEKVRLIPVLFELGARPHPPRDLYRAYLDQSHIFIGIYWQRYGWVAPDMEISGLEDEYRLAARMPKLIYIKSPAPDREPRLKALLDDVKNDDVSYKYFSTPAELAELVQNDLAVLLTERFEQAVRPQPAASAPQPEQPLRLPRPLTALIGRDADVTAVCDLLQRPDVRLVTLTGPGGVGKTSLSLEIAAALADAFPDGVHWTPLAAITTPEQVISAIAQTLDVRESRGQSLMHSLKAYLRSRRVLLLLDNFEQVVAAAPLVADLLTAVSHLTILVTSRAPLRLRGEREYPVAPLPLPVTVQVDALDRINQNEAVRLFVARAQAVNPAFALTAGNAAAVAEIVRRLDGLPLAIELAAARVKLLPPQAILKRLESRLQILTGGAADLPARQQTMRNAIDWSYSLLERETQTLFARLSVFAGDFTLEAAEAVCAQDGDVDVFEGTAVLLDNSLLRQTPAPDDQPRFGMLETIREYAAERLDNAGETAVVRRRHAAHFADLALNAGASLFSTDDQRWLARLGADYQNLRAALAYFMQQPAEQETGWRMIVSLTWLWYRRGYLDEARQWFEQAIAQSPALGKSALRGQMLQYAGSVAMWRSDYAAAARLMDEALAILRATDDALLLGVALFNRGVLATNQGEPDRAQAMLDEALPLFRQVGQTWLQAMTLLHLGNVALARGDTDAAHSFTAESLALGRKVGDEWVIASAINNLGGEIARYQGNYAEAEQHYLESRELFQSIESFPDVARANHSLGYVAMSRGDGAQARALFLEALELHQKLGVQRGVAECLLGVAAVLVRQGEAETAVRLMAAAQRQFQRLGAGIWPADRADYERSLALVREQLADEEIEAATAVGEAMSLEAAVALAAGGAAAA